MESAVEELKRVAFQCAGRAFGFALLANIVTMIGFSYDLLLSVEIGVVLFALTAAVFLLSAERARIRDYRRTELWSWLPPDQRPAAQHAQWAVGQALREAYLTFARQAGLASGALVLIALVLVLLPR
jgi:hypothetical protein